MQGKLFYLDFTKVKKRLRHRINRSILRVWHVAAQCAEGLEPNSMGMQVAESKAFISYSLGGCFQWTELFPQEPDQALILASMSPATEMGITPHSFLPG